MAETQAGNNWTTIFKGSVLGILWAAAILLVSAIIKMDRIVVKVEGHESRISAIEQCMVKEQERQPMRDYLLVELAKKSGITIPKELR